MMLFIYIFQGMLEFMLGMILMEPILLAIGWLLKWIILPAIGILILYALVTHP